MKLAQCREELARASTDAERAAWMAIIEKKEARIAAGGKEEDIVRLHGVPSGENPWDTQFGER